LSMITYLDRVCFGSALNDIKKALGLNSVADLNLAITAFAFSYAVFEVPSGWLGDVYGPRKTLIRIVLWWSLFTAVTGVVGLGYFGDKPAAPANETKVEAAGAKEKDSSKDVDPQGASGKSKAKPWIQIS